MLSRGRAAALVLACLGGVLLVAWAAANGPVGGEPEQVEPAPTFIVPSPERPSQSPSPSASPSNGPESGKAGAGPDLSWIRYVVLGALLTGALLLLARAMPRLARMWRELPDTGPREDRTDLGVLPGPDELRQVLADDRSRQLAAVDRGSPRNGIVAAWGRLEEITAESGLPRKSWETSAEFTVRMLKALDIDPRAAGELAELYRRARFSSHDVDEQHRDRARDALGRLHDEIRQLR